MRNQNHEQSLAEDLQALDADWMRPPSAPKRFTEQELWFMNRVMELERERDDAKRQCGFYRLMLDYERRKWGAYKEALIQKIKSLAGMLRRQHADDLREAEEAARVGPSNAELAS